MVERGSFRSAHWICSKCNTKVVVKYIIASGRRRPELIKCDCLQFPRDEDLNSGPR